MLIILSTRKVYWQTKISSGRKKDARGRLENWTLKSD